MICFGSNLKWMSTPYVNKQFVYILNCCIFLKYDVLSEYLTLFWFAMLLNEYEIEFMFRIIRNIRNLGNVYIRGFSHCYEQNALDFHFNSNLKCIFRVLCSLSSFFQDVR